MGWTTSRARKNGNSQRSRPVDASSSDTSSSLEVFVARRPARLRLQISRGGNTVHNARYTILGVSGFDSALAVLCTASQAHFRVGPVRDMEFWVSDAHGNYWNRDWDMDLLAV